MTPIKHIYFLGIGGIGMSALARYFHRSGTRVSGYDKTPSIVTEELEKEGITIFFEQDPAHIQTVSHFVYTPAIKESIEMTAAIEKGIPTLKRAQVLGEISKEFTTLAVAGTHGKTTTSSMLTHFMRTCGVDCTAFLGGISNNIQGNFVFGESDYCVVEADEFDRSFLTLSPTFAIITSLDADHLDIYGNEDAVRNSYRDFAHKILPTGKLLVHHSIQDFDWGREVETYGIAAGNYRAENLRFDKLATYFDYKSDTHFIPNLCLPLPGRHNVLNATAAITLTLWAGGKEANIPHALSSFSGIYRRFEVQSHTDALSLIDDYAHHPTELEAAIDTARSLFPERQLIVIFQPHLFTRTRDFYKGFATALSKADEAVLLPIYPAREKPIEGINANLIYQHIQTNKHLIEKHQIIPTLSQIIKRPAVILTTGAGDIDREVHAIHHWTQGQ